MFDIAQTLPEPEKTMLEELVIDAFIMGKKMDGKLKSYKADWDSGFYETNSDRAEDRKKRLG